MRLLILTLAPLSSGAGHLARLSLELKDLSQLNKIFVLCLGRCPDDEYTKNQYPKVSFSHLPIKFDGWSVSNLAEAVSSIGHFIKEIEPDLVVLQMEVWDLMRELGLILTGVVPFATIVHAMPFLGSPLNPSGNFEADVSEYVNSDIEEFRKKYIQDHYEEAEDVFNRVAIIANNKTVAFYLKTYFKDIQLQEMVPFPAAKRLGGVVALKEQIYDFVYMARMEAGKGVEYLSQILKRISILLNRRIAVAILGRVDDCSSKEALDTLLAESLKSEYFSVIYLGWADKDLKEQVLTHSGVFLYPSRYDNYPTVLNEALAYGLPSIVWDVPFARLNYIDTEAVKRAPIFDFQQFAQNAFDAFAGRDRLSKIAFDFIDSFDRPSEIAISDTNIFRQIANIK